MSPITAGPRTWKAVLAKAVIMRKKKNEPMFGLNAVPIEAIVKSVDVVMAT